MYINGKETSHYIGKEFEAFRKKYVSNIFQDFNLVNSYTVYQNVELILLLNGYKKRKIKKRVLEIINEVGLIEFKNTKASKLFGGQKQKVAIARALAKDTPIVIADEPTGNLDSESAKGIIKLLSQIAKNKLVIIVTHNYEQVEEHVQRKITIHVGVKKRDIYKMFLGETIAMTTMANLPGIILMAYILNMLAKLSFMEGLFIINVITVSLAIIFVYTFNLIVGLFPVFSVVRKTPAQILSRHDL